MSKFNIGDRVRLLSDRQRLRAGAVGTVADDSSIPFVEWDGFTSGHGGPHGDGRTTMWAVDENALELVMEESAAPTFKAGERVKIARKIKWEGWFASMDAYVGRVETINSIYEEDGDVRAFIDGWFFPVEALDLAEERAPWELALESGDFYVQAIEEKYHVFRGSPGRLDMHHIGSGRVYRDNTTDERAREFFGEGRWRLIEMTKADTTVSVDSLSADYRKAQAVHTEALARCAAARQQYADAEDEMNSASDRLEAVGKALLEAIAKQ